METTNEIESLLRELIAEIRGLGLNGADTKLGAIEVLAGEIKKLRMSNESEGIKLREALSDCVQYIKD